MGAQGGQYAVRIGRDLEPERSRQLSCAKPAASTEPRSTGRGRTFESCRAHGLFKPISRARNAEKCAIRTSYSASATAGDAEEPCPPGAGGEGVLGFADGRPGGLGTSEDGLLQDRRTPVERLPPRPQADRNLTRVSFRSIRWPWRMSPMISGEHSTSTVGGQLARAHGEACSLWAVRRQMLVIAPSADMSIDLTRPPGTSVPTECRRPGWKSLKPPPGGLLAGLSEVWTVTRCLGRPRAWRPTIPGDSFVSS
jgi:hypothetical protein